MTIDDLRTRAAQQVTNACAAGLGHFDLAVELALQAGQLAAERDRLEREIGEMKMIMEADHFPPPPRTPDALRADAKNVWAELETIAPWRDPHGCKISMNGNIRERLLTAIMRGGNSDMYEIIDENIRLQTLVDAQGRLIDYMGTRIDTMREILARRAERVEMQKPAGERY